MIALLFASVWVWAIVFEKITSLRRAEHGRRRRSRTGSGPAAASTNCTRTRAPSPTHPMAAVFGAAMGEWRRSLRVAGADISRSGVRDRVERAMGVTIQREMERHGDAG